MASGTLHVVALPHTQTDGTYATCAYTSRVMKFCKQMIGRGRKVILYGGEFNTAPCDEHVVIVTEEQRQAWFGGHDENDLSRGGSFDWEWTSPWWLESCARAASEIRSRMEITDLLCLSAGLAQRLVANAVPEMIVAEIMVGYEGILQKREPSPAYAAFESQSHRALVYGKHGLQLEPREPDIVIPNSFDPDELPAGAGDQGYLLFMGRVILKKGLQYACALSNATGMRLVVAGPGGTQRGDVLVGEHGEWRCNQLDYIGAVGVEDRAKLMGGAACLLAPTLYVEPFGGVAVEAMMCGTPAVTTDFGAFTETVMNGVSGYRFRTLQDGVEAIEAALHLDRDRVRQYALARYSLEAVRPLYERWFQDLDGFWGEGWMKLRSPQDAARMAA